jgi:electron transport complex protein RnfE
MIKKFFTELRHGIFKRNPIFVLVLGLCPTLAITTSVQNALGMSMATAFVLIGSSTIISALRKFIPGEIRIPGYIVVIASFVSVVELIMKGYFPALSHALGIFIPLIVVNCIIMGRAEAYAGRNPVLYSIADAIGVSIGFTLALVSIAALREILGAGKLLGASLFGSSYAPMLVMVFAPGALLTIGLYMGLINFLNRRSSARQK